MPPSKLIRWSGVAAALGAALLVIKGVVIVVSEADPGLIPPATLLFALGMLGLHALLGGRGGRLGKVGLLLALAAAGASVVNLVALALPLPAPGEPDASPVLEITYMVAFLSILVGLLVLGISALTAGVMPAPWSAVPLAVGIVWFPLQGLGFVISDGVGLILGGLTWALLGYVLYSAESPQNQRPARVR